MRTVQRAASRRVREQSRRLEANDKLIKNLLDRALPVCRLKEKTAVFALGDYYLMSSVGQLQISIRRPPLPVPPKQTEQKACTEHRVKVEALKGSDSEDLIKTEK